MTQPSVEDQVVDFYYGLFDRVFTQPFRARIGERLRRDAVARQVQASAAAASRSLVRFLVAQQLTPEQAAALLGRLAALGDLLNLEQVGNPNLTPEAMVEGLLPRLPPPEALGRSGMEAVYRVALHSVVQALMQIGPVMAEWQRLRFATTFELPRRVANRLNQIGEQLDALGRAGQEAADERFELTYRDYLVQRFHRIEAGTVRMNTSLDVDLRELFVMPRVKRPPPGARRSARTTGDAPRPHGSRTGWGQRPDGSGVGPPAAFR